MSKEELKEKIKKIHETSKTKISDRNLANILGISPTYAGRLRREMNIPSTEDDAEEFRNSLKDVFITEYFGNKLSSEEISYKYNISADLVRKEIVSQGYKLRTDGDDKRFNELNRYYFDNITTEEQVYLFGVLCSKASFGYQAFKLELDENKFNYLQKIMNLIHPDGSGVFIKENQAKIHVTNKYICEKLYLLGCTHDKMSTFVWPEWIDNDNFKKWFIRGYFDGDGLFLMYKKAKIHTECMSIVGTQTMMHSLVDVLKERCNISLFSLTNVKSKSKGYVRSTLKIKDPSEFKNVLIYLYKDSKIHCDINYNKFISVTGGK